MDNYTSFEIELTSLDSYGIENFEIELYPKETYGTELTITLPFQDRLGLNVYVSETEPISNKIVEGSVWIKRPNSQETIYILDRIDTSEDFTNTIIILTRDGFEEVNLYSGLGFTTLLSIRQVQYSNGELVQILPYWIYRDGEWVSTENTRTQGVKLKLKNFSINVNNDFNETDFVGVENVSINEVENEYGSLNETFAINVNETIEIGLSSIVENVII
jgi:hypothetical protein